MLSPRRIPSPLRASLAGLLAILVFAVANLVHLPALHHALHGGHAADHAHSPESADSPAETGCAVALFAQGVDAPATDPLSARPDEKPAATLRLLAHAAPRVSPARRLPPGQAPPASAAVL